MLKSLLRSRRSINQLNPNFNSSLVAVHDFISNDSSKPKFNRIPPSSTISNVAQLSKSRLASFVVLTTMSGFAMAPFTCTASPVDLFITSIGTALCISSANTFNQLFEVPYDTQMTRTRNRPIVTRKVSPLSAAVYGTISGISGIGMLCLLINPLVGTLGALNILLYSGVYTQMKRYTVLNTWIGALVGAIPPMMGWAAVTGELDPGAWLLAASLYAWQFPHFNALSWNIRHDYSKAGFQMLSLTNPRHNSLVSFRYSLSLFPICFLLSHFAITSPCFILTSSIPNSIMTYFAYKFWKDGNGTNDKHAKKLFYSSLFHLPILIILMMIHKRSWPGEKDRVKRIDPVLHQPFGVHVSEESDHK